MPGFNKFAQNSIYLSSQQATRYFGKLPLRVVMRFVFFRSKLRGIRPLAIDVNSLIFTSLREKIHKIKVAINRNLTGAELNEDLDLKSKECLDNVESGLTNLTNLASIPLAKLYMDYYCDPVKVSCPELQVTQAKMVILEQLRFMVFEKKDLKTDWAEKKASKGKGKGKTLTIEVVHRGDAGEEVKKGMHAMGEAGLIKCKTPDVI
ncbi:hypothetical protein PsalMR5_00614 [Piscirickettsia salmonis]|nr:hypothetical protein [Piscirickettsia salmonis]QGP53209.1 hypothetical protein PsalSR1_00615 [Piscirickettsia salmonis]QGP60854.1 hypothetical protein PsalBI1_03476 [Piscirickettsia salmonis]QGP62775.1 hypothetical protein PsalMR5_00614 [Piscirickettsia salmonis]